MQNFIRGAIYIAAGIYVVRKDKDVVLEYQARPNPEAEGPSERPMGVSLFLQSSEYATNEVVGVLKNGIVHRRLIRRIQFKGIDPYLKR